MPLPCMQQGFDGNCSQNLLHALAEMTAPSLPPPYLASLHWFDSTRSNVSLKLELHFFNSLGLRPIIFFSAFLFTMEAQRVHFLCQERYGMVVSKCGKLTERLARFPNPCTGSSVDAERIAGRAHLLFEQISSRDKGWPQKVNFKGWACPQKNWDKWVEKLEAEYSIVWNQTGIYDAIISSCCEIRCNKEIIVGLAEFWCTETNTFVFPWGEATITVEDVMILGGFSVLGEPIKKPVTTGALKMAVDAMRERKTAMSRERSKKATHGAWMKHFMENDSEFEHVAFLSLWLSRYVFPFAKETISKDVFSIAAHLSGGTQMALAPPILAGLYKNLRLLKEKALSSDDDEITVFAPFHLVLLWAFEHFPHLVQKPPNILKLGEPRAARWHKVICKMDKSVVNTIFKSGQYFQWRPYAANISNWNHSSYYRVEKHLLVDSKKNSDKDWQCYVICMTMSDLVGLDCKEKYMPHRVAMQFGMDQDLPGEFSGLGFVPENVYFFVPPRSFEPCVSLKYFEWWKNSEFICGGRVPNVLRRSSDTFQIPPAEGGELSSKDYHTPSVATRLKNGETISRSSTKYTAIEVQDDEQKFDEWKDIKDVLFEPFCKSDFPTRETDAMSRRATSEEVCLVETTRKRKLSTSTEGTSNGKATVSMINGRTDELQRVQGDTKTSKKAVEDDEVDHTNRCIKATMDVGGRNFRIRQDVSKEGVAKVSVNYAMNAVDKNGLLRTPTTFEECDLEKRIQKLEKLLGISPQIYIG